MLSNGTVLLGDAVEIHSNLLGKLRTLLVARILVSMFAFFLCFFSFFHIFCFLSFIFLFFSFLFFCRVVLCFAALCCVGPSLPGVKKKDTSPKKYLGIWLASAYGKERFGARAYLQITSSQGVIWS